jgi:DNA-damage-inducible protein J
MELSVSDVIRLLMIRMAEEHQLPFPIKVPKAAAQPAIAGREAGQGKYAQPADEAGLKAKD